MSYVCKEKLLTATSLSKVSPSYLPNSTANVCRGSALTDSASHVCDMRPQVYIKAARGGRLRQLERLGVLGFREKGESVS